MAAALCDLGRQAELIPLARTWLAQPPAPRRLAAAAFALAWAGDLDGALEAAKREDLVSPGRSTLEMIRLARGEYREAELADPSAGVMPDEARAVRTFVDALAARAHGEPARGRAMLRDFIRARRVTERVVPAFALGQACAEDGDLDCAVTALRHYRTEWDPTIIFQSWMLPRSTLLLAEMLQLQGHVDEARGLVEKLLSDWRNADPDLPDLARARALCTRLRCHPAPPAASPRDTSSGSARQRPEN